MTRICIIQGHPTSGDAHLCHTLARAYAEGAVNAGHEVNTVIVADLDFPILRSKQDWDSGQAPPEGFPGAGTAAWFCHVDVGQG